MSNHARDQFELDPHSRFRAFDESEGVLLMQESAEVIVTNATGSRVVQLIADHKDLDEIATTISDEFDVPTRDARADVEKFTSELLETGAIRRCPGTR